MIGTELIARATPDGYTVGIGTFPTLVTNRILLPKLPYDPDRDIQLIVQYSRACNILAVTPSLPVYSVQELIDYARKERGKVLDASSGVGTSLHLSAELFKRMAGVQITHVPFKGQAPAITGLIAGQVQMMFDNLSSISGHVHAGRVRGLAVTSAQRLASFPELPTVAEAGVANFEVTTYGGVVAPGSMPKATIHRLNAEINRALATSTVKEKFGAFGSEPAGGTPEEFAAFIKRESVRWAEVIRAANIKAE